MFENPLRNRVVYIFEQGGRNAIRFSVPLVKLTHDRKLGGVRR